MSNNASVDDVFGTEEEVPGPENIADDDASSNKDK